MDSLPHPPAHKTSSSPVLSKSNEQNAGKIGQNGFEVAVFRHISHGKSPNVFKEQSNKILQLLIMINITIEIYSNKAVIGDKIPMLKAVTHVSEIGIM